MEDSPSSVVLHPTSSKNQPSFQHTELDLETASIRLIEVLPLGPDGVVRCNIKHATIVAKYTCLSYVWGPPEDTHFIYVNEKLFRVRRNLWDFLHMVSIQRAAVTSWTEASGELIIRDARLPLWIDALCIDQENNSEKNHQVQQMGKIFSNAELVIAWIGKKPQIASLFCYLRKLMQERSHLIHPSCSRAIRDLGADIYWKRAWITQEVQLARQVFLFADTEEIDLALLQNELGRLLQICLGQLHYDQYWLPIRRTIERRDVKVIENMGRFEAKQCSDPLDLVYSLRAISTDGPRLRVEYSISRTDLAHSVLRLAKNELCLRRVWTVVRTLMTANENHAFLKPSLSLQAQLLDEKEERCHECQARVRFPPPNAVVPDNAYLHCLSCQHSYQGENFHLHFFFGMVGEHESKEEVQPEWAMFALYTSYLLKCQRLCQAHATLIPDTNSATFQFSLESCQNFISHSYFWRFLNRPKLDWFEEPYQEQEVDDRPNCSWKLIEHDAVNAG